ncbi:MAG: hypothetical protein LUD72_14425 [Bacteroidales bacterium]|nr:hypothetical protein [Bacteroidales bacterium]
MSDLPEVYCNACGTTFTPEIEEAEIAGRDGVVEQYFTCPECGAHFTINCTDEKMRKMISERAKIPSQINHLRGKGISTRKYINKDNKLKSDLKKMSSELTEDIQKGE